ncbi:hypothetical protein [Dongia sp.]|uniref:hypothetical protein n=1 Tax=Dongia sp. TaxID=1977262 RepID=UPI0035B0929A
MTIRLAPLARKVLHLAVLAQMGLGGLALPLVPAFADTPGDLAEPAPEVPGDLAPDAVAVTDPAEIKKKLSELTIYGRYFDGEDWIEYHLADGRTAYFEKGCTYPGKWWVDQGEVCYAYPNYRDGAANCFVMFVRPNGAIQFVAFGADQAPYLASSSIRLAPGNDAHLPLNGVSPCLSV